MFNPKVLRPARPTQPNGMPLAPGTPPPLPAGMEPPGGGLLTQGVRNQLWQATGFNPITQYNMPEAEPRVIPGQVPGSFGPNDAPVRKPFLRKPVQWPGQQQPVTPNRQMAGGWSSMKPGMSRGLKMLAKGGKIKKGETAIVGEGGTPELVRVGKKGADVTPMPYIPTSKDVQTKKKNWEMKLGNQTVAKGTDTKNVYPTSPDPYLKSLGTDYQQRQDQLARIQENEQAAMELLRGSIGDTEQASQEMMARGIQMAGGIDQAMGAASGALAAGGQAADQMVHDVNAAGNRAIGNVQDAVGGALEWAQRSGAEDVADAEQRADRQARLGERLYEEGMEEIRRDTTEGLAKYHDMTAQMVSRKSGAVNQYYDQKSAEMVALAAEQGASPESIEAMKARNEMSRFSEMEELGNQVGIEYNNTMANLRLQYTGEKMNTLRNLSGLVGGLVESGNQMVAQVRMSVGERIGNLQQLGVQAAVSMNEAALQAKSWAVQRAGEIKARIAEGQSQLHIAGQQMKLADAQLRENLKLAYDSAKRVGLTELADATWKQTESFVPLSPLMATVLNFWTQRELMGKSEYATMMLNVQGAQEQAPRQRGSRSGMGRQVASGSQRGQAPRGQAPARQKPASQAGKQGGSSTVMKSHGVGY